MIVWSFLIVSFQHWSELLEDWFLHPPHGDDRCRLNFVNLLMKKVCHAWKMLHLVVLGLIWCLHGSRGQMCGGCVCLASHCSKHLSNRVFLFESEIDSYVHVRGLSRDEGTARRGEVLILSLLGVPADTRVLGCPSDSFCPSLLVQGMFALYTLLKPAFLLLTVTGSDMAQQIYNRSLMWGIKCPPATGCEFDFVVEKKTGASLHLDPTD